MKARFVILAVLVALIALPDQGQGQERRQTTRTTVSRRQPQRSSNSRVTATVQKTSSVGTMRLVQSRSGYRSYGNYGRGYNYRYNYGYGGYYMDGYAGPLAIGGAAVATALKSSPSGVIGGVVLGWLLGRHLDNAKVQQPVETVEWYEDSSGGRYWRKAGVQTRTARPTWVDQPAKILSEQSEEIPAEEVSDEPDESEESELPAAPMPY